MTQLKVPPIVAESYKELYDLCENHNRNGVLNPKDVAAFLGKDYQWFNSCIYAGAVPFAFGTNKMVGRGTIAAVRRQLLRCPPYHKQQVLEK